MTNPYSPVAVRTFGAWDGASRYKTYSARACRTAPAEKTTAEKRPRKQAGAISVVDKSGKLRGLVTDYDIRKALQNGADIRKLSITKIMNTKPRAIRSDQLAVDAVEIMTDRATPFNVLPVINKKGVAVGMVQMHDIRSRDL